MTLPAAGEVFALEVAPRVELLLRVVAEHGETRCVVATQHAGPPLAKPPRGVALFEVQPLDHHAWNRPLLGGWISTPAPASLRRLGRVPVREAERARVLHPQLWVTMPAKTPALAQKVLPMSGWDLVLRDAKAQWRWEHERAAVLAEDAQRERAQAGTLATALAAQGRAQASLRQKGVAALKKKRFFAAWKHVVPKALIDEAEAATREAVRSLEGRTPAQAARRLAALVRTFNRLDGRHGRTFDTADREDIMEALGTIALACRVDDETFEAVVDAVRDF